MAFSRSGSLSTWFLVELEFGNVGFWGEGKNRTIRRKTSRSKGENQQQTQPTYGVDARISTRARLVRGECSHHCATNAPLGFALCTEEKRSRSTILRPMFIHTALAMRRRKSSGRRSKPNWGKGQLPRCHTPSTVWHGWADVFRISVLCLQKSPYELSWLCSLMKFVRYLLLNSKGVLCVWVKTLSKTFIAELTSNSYILVT